MRRDAVGVPTPSLAQRGKAGMGARPMVGIARTLRGNATDTERMLWRKIRDKQIEGHRFRRQRPIGKYIVDFVCLEAKLVFELDGGHHAEQYDGDEIRSQFLKQQGFRVIRFWNNEVIENMDGVLDRIREELHRSVQITPSQPSPWQGKELVGGDRT